MKEGRRPKQLASFWIGPLVAGSCLATGYELTQRVMILKSNLQEPATELFQNRGNYPGKRLEALRKLHPNGHKTSLIEEEKKISPTLTALQEKEMKTVLDALDPISEDSENPNQTHKQRSISRLIVQEVITLDTQQIFKRKAFDDLFKTLQTP